MARARSMSHAVCVTTTSASISTKAAFAVSAAGRAAINSTFGSSPKTYPFIQPQSISVIDSGSTSRGGDEAKHFVPVGNAGGGLIQAAIMALFLTATDTNTSLNR